MHKSEMVLSLYHSDPILYFFDETKDPQTWNKLIGRVLNNYTELFIHTE